ncbi:hypothetical protein [Methylocella silvestris]|uniref:Uncharacterized protein n=1 Tax=Methylocella silvestris TaxID=199596 RepID=A0A2J7TIC1_METSI|nr:hypothetical protein [Methylocella silvestris]PNG26520.1 hypothetical protein CR492_07435 [Methylocella silvestris]
MKKLLTALTLSAIFASGAAFAYNGTPNAAAGARGHNAPSSAEATPGVIAGHPHAKAETFREAEAGESYHGPFSPTRNHRFD